MFSVHFRLMHHKIWTALKLLCSGDEAFSIFCGNYIDMLKAVGVLLLKEKKIAVWLQQGPWNTIVMTLHTRRAID